MRGYILGGSISTASAVRRYRDDPIDDGLLERCLLAATWAPSGANQQPWRFVVLRSAAARKVISQGAQRTWHAMADYYGIAEPPAEAADAKSRVLRTMAEHMRVGGGAPVPAMQNFLLPARAQGLGAAITLWHYSCEDELAEVVGIPGDWRIAALITLGWPRGRHRRVQRKPLSEVVALDHWTCPWSGEGR